MKKTSFSNKSNNSSSTIKNNPIVVFEKLIHNYKSIIQKTLISIQKYKQFDIIGANELNIATQNLEKLYVELSNNIILLKNKNNLNKVKSNLENIKSDLNNLFRLYGTENIDDVITICFGDEYLKNIEWDKNKYNILKQYFHPINFKVMPWKTERNNYSDKTIEKNKIIEDFIIVEKSDNLDCFDLARSSKTFQTKVYGIKLALHNEKEKKTIIVAGLIDDILTNCIDNDFINDKIEEIIKTFKNDAECEIKIFERFIQSLTLKELIVYSHDELRNKYEGYLNQISLFKQKTISQTVKEFINDDLYGQRKTLIQLLLKSDEHEYQYLAYLLYDLLSNDNNGNIDTTEQTLLFDSLPWKIKSFFKDAMKQTISYTNDLSNFDNSKIPLEQQICLMKAPDSVKEKAMNKLKEVKAKADDTGSKAKAYLDGLLKIPFGIYKEEPILKTMDEMKELFKNVLKKSNDAHLELQLENEENITNVSIKNTCEFIKNNYLQNKEDLIVSLLKKTFTPSKRTDLVINICNINNIIKKLKMKKTKLIHSGKKINYMKEQIKEFIEETKNNNQVTEELTTLKDISKYSLLKNINDDIEKIEDKWMNINNYIHEVRDTLDSAVHGHDKAKTQIERILAQWINGEQSGYCFGFEGPPGVGKTSFAKKGLANCLRDNESNCRPFSFIAIGGQDNGSTLNGHNYTYVGSEWGKFVDIIMKHKCMNPIIFIDELDKVSKTEHGKEIIGILTHLVDPTQNDVFQDKYFNGIEIDLSKALFIFSYNDASSIDKILLDRIHRIKFEHLTIEDKIVITRKHILPEIYKNMGLENCIEISDDNIIYMIENYTNEPGIRKFKELLFEIIGEINLKFLKNNSTITLPIKLSNNDIKFNYLKDYNQQLLKCIPSESKVGVINGLWANSMGNGGIIPIEVKYFPSNTFLELKLTGMQGDVMKESMNVSKTLSMSLVEEKLMEKIIKKIEENKIQGIHVHCPEGAIPKDGPSAGTAITCAMYSLLTKKKIKNTIAITGEINLQGCVTAIGGLDLKILGGIKGGVKTFIFPKENIKDFQNFKDKYNDKSLIEGISFVPVENINQVLKLIFED
tara:strand:+ start:4246 stop:7500 length:3255 start_codon:yes stop_codon:yes gene_type:complete